MTARRDAPRRIRAALAGAAGGHSVRELAEATDLHENAVRRTLAALIAEGEVRVDRHPPRGRGRPRLRYRLVGAADEPFKAVLPLLLGLLDPSSAREGAAYATGFAHVAPTPPPGSGGAREALFASLVNLGFAPVEQPAGASAQVTLELTRCPFTDAVATSANGRQICHLHHGLLAGVAAASGGALDHFVINDPRVVPCRVAFREIAPAAEVAS